MQETQTTVDGVNERLRLFERKKAIYKQLEDLRKQIEEKEAHLASL